MKTSHIIGIVAIAIAIGILITSAGDASKYVSFDEALEMSQADDDSHIHVIGQLKKNEQGEVVGIEHGEDKISFSFLMLDENNHQEKVFFNQPMPPDFVKSEKVVVVGRFQKHQFTADKILLKCPSKYEEEKEFSANAE